MNIHRFLLVALMTPPLLAQAGTPIDQTRALNADGRVRIDNVKGSVQVRTWDRAEVHVGGTLGDGVKELQVQGEGTSVRVRVEYPEGSGWFGGKHSEPSDLVVNVPTGAEVEVNVVSADVDVAGVAGRRLTIESVSGSVRADGKPGEAELESVSGSVVTKLETPDLKVSSVSGELRVENNTANSEVELETVSGDIDLRAGEIKRLRMHSVSGGADAQLQALSTGGGIKAETLSGRLDLSLPSKTSAAVHITTFSGDIRSAVGEVKRNRYGPGASLDARVGEGDGRIELESFSGSVHLDLH